MRSVVLAAVALAFAVLGHVQASDEPQDAVAAGQALAQEHCATCHDIAPGGAFKQYPPSFASIAKYRSEEQIYARIVFPPLHASMPSVALYALNHSQVDALVAYILSLEE